MVTGPMPRKPNATRPNANTAGAFMISSTPSDADAVGDAHQGGDHEAHPVGAEVAGGQAGQDVQRGAAFAGRRDDLLDVLGLVEVKTLIISGMIAPASVPQVMMSRELPPEAVVVAAGAQRGISRYDTMKVIATETSDVSHTSCVSGVSKFILSALP